MAKVRRTIRCNLPTYQLNQEQWRRDIVDHVRKAAISAGVRYDRGDRLEVVVLLYLSDGKRLDIHDVDNRLKDILDALQGRFKSSRERDKEACVIENDNQIYRVVIEKQRIPKRFGNDAGGRILIRSYEPRRWPLQTTKGNKLLKAFNRTAL